MPLRKSTAVSGLALLLAAAASMASAQDAQHIDPARLNAHIAALADDAMGGRGPTTPGEEAAVNYVADQFKAMGLEPAGDNGTWFQTVPINRFLQDGPAILSANAGGEALTFNRGTDVIVGSHRPVSRISLTDVPVVFVGYGVTAPERGWDDFKGVDVRGKIVLMLVNDPDFEVAADSPLAGKFDGKGMTYYGRWVYKFEEAARRGAAGVLVIHETAGAGYPWTTLQNSSTAAGFDIVRDNVEAERVQAQGWIQQPIAAKLMAAAGLDYATLKAQAQTADFHPVALNGVTMSMDFGLKYERLTTRNVAGKLTGTTRPNETVMFGAHWDAYGHATPNAQGDDIYNGAVDNASGVAGVLELARLFAAAPRTERSQIFVSWAAEEAGLLGAYYYAAHPLVPLETTVANINMDSLLPGGPSPEIVVIGYGKTDLQDRLARDAAKEGRTLIADPAPQVGAFYRSDHFPLAKMGVPALFAAAGFTGASEASRIYVRDRYHQPTDAWEPGWDMTGAAADVQLLYEVGRDLAIGTDWPKWTPGNEFEGVREASAASRK
ncbi:M28 family metallopeptidase [Brevundimonas goettingensis]|uniref:M28 family peptidase n=1 Tax=Brevundimonas goettingensis TaxID=2774190 RepID=A0A975GVZ2_9CAUL|nr:M28 family metallopeptidase [Brevundimonas goettingensis]QTC92036.1 M28 family peptidase [Brevundimonas goettingensis]